MFLIIFIHKHCHNNVRMLMRTVKKKLKIIIIQSSVPRFVNINEIINILNDELITDD